MKLSRKQLGTSIASIALSAALLAGCGKGTSAATSGPASTPDASVSSSMPVDSSVPDSSIVEETVDLEELRQQPDYRVKQVYLMLKAYIENDEFSAEEIANVANPDGSFVRGEYVPTEVISNTTQGGIAKTAYQEMGTAGSFFYPIDNERVLELVEHLLSCDNDSKVNSKIALELTEYYLTIRQYHNMDSAIEPFDYMGCTYDLSKDYSLRALILATGSQEGVTQAIVRYRYDVIDREQLIYYIENPLAAFEEFVTKINSRCEQGNDGIYRLYEQGNTDASIMMAAAPYEGTFVLGVGTEAMPNIVIEDEKAFAMLEMVSYFEDSGKMISQIAAYDYMGIIFPATLSRMGVENPNDFKPDFGSFSFVLLDSMKLNLEIEIDNEFIELGRQKTL